MVKINLGAALLLLEKTKNKVFSQVLVFPQPCSPNLYIEAEGYSISSI
jgi:hypothetical protein